MVRKNLLDGLMEAPAPAAPRRAETDGPRPRGAPGASGAIGAVSQGIAELRARALIEIEPERIDAGGLEDRLEHDAEDHARLVASIAEHGQQVPVLVRPSASGRYQIVYGRRRVAACRDLGRPVRALVRDLDDDALIVAQGQENSARRDLSFIERANFARQMTEAGFAQKLVAEALHIDKSGVSRLLKVAQAVPMALIRAIGSAPGIGRDRWLALAAALARTALLEDEVTALARGETSDARFEAVCAGLAAAEAELRAAPEPGPARDEDAVRRMETRSRRMGEGIAVLEVQGHPDFTRWLAGEMPALHARWLSGTQ